MDFPALTLEQLESEACLAADLVRDAATRRDDQAEAEAEELLQELLTALSRREAIAA